MRALALSILVHAMLIAFIVATPSRSRATRTLVPTSLVDVTLFERSEPGGSTMPALPDAQPSPVVMERAREATVRGPAIARRRVRIPRSREHTPEDAVRIAPPVTDIASAPDPSAESETSTVPSSIGDRTSTADQLGWRGRGRGTRR